MNVPNHHVGGMFAPWRRDKLSHRGAGELVQRVLPAWLHTQISQMKQEKLKIQIYPSPILTRKCSKVEDINFSINKLLDEMSELMKANDGAGLAANQAGVNQAVVVINAPEKIYKLINPRITKKAGKIIFDEGCLSFPELSLSIRRAKEVWVNFQDEQAREVDLKAEGVLAVIFQHEIDHINGISFIERIPFWQRLKIRSKLRKIKKLYKKDSDLKER